MSADAGRVCPKCYEKAEESYRSLQQKVKQQYGKLPLDKYNELCSEAAKPIIKNETLREDFEIYTEDSGWFVIYYTCQCEKCGFKHNFSYRECLLPPTDTDRGQK